MSGARVLVVDDEPDICRLLKEILEDEGYEIATAATAAAARALYREAPPDLVLLDIWLPDTDGITLLREWDARAVPVVMMSGHGTVETAVEAVRLGAEDFIEKPLGTAKLLVTLERVLEAHRLRRENLRLRKRVESARVLIGRSGVTQLLRAQLERVAQHDSWVLITGEPGVGKAVAARFLHDRSSRRERPLVEVSLAAVPAENVPVQLFGAETDGNVNPGSFEQAQGGTLVLDEIGDLDLAAQARLLNALEDKRFLRVGGRRPVDIDVRIIAVTNKDLPEAIAAGTFREDLYYRLNVVPLRVPSLREHREDVPELAAHFVNDLVEKEGLAYRRFTTAALNLLRNQAWPGNVRELKNLVQRLLIVGHGGDIDAAEVEAALAPAARAEGPLSETWFELPLREARDRFETAYLEHHLRRTGGNVAQLAEIAGMERTHLYRKLKSLGVPPRALPPADAAQE